MTYNFQILNCDLEDNSTDNLSRKYNKLLASYGKNPTNEKLNRINNLKLILYPEKKVTKPKYFSRKKIRAVVFKLLRDNKNIRKYFDERVYMIYIRLYNVLPHDLIVTIIGLCNFNLRRFVLSIPKEIYIFAQPMVKNNGVKNRLIEHYKKNRQMVNLICNLHSMKSK